MDQCRIQGESKTLIRLTLQKTEISTGSMGHLARKNLALTLNALSKTKGDEYFQPNSSDKQKNIETKQAYW